MTLLRKIVATVLFCVLLAGIAFAFWPYVEAQQEMKAYCAALKPGSTLAEIQTAAAQQGYELSEETPGRAVLTHPASFGRLNCELQLSESGLVAASFSRR
jgi:hypothetical protein